MSDDYTFGERPDDGWAFTADFHEPLTMDVHAIWTAMLADVLCAAAEARELEPEALA